MEDFLPILIFIVFTLFSALGRKKTKDNKKPKKGKGSSIFDDLMEQLKIEKEPIEESPNAVIIEEKEEILEPQNIRDYISERKEKSVRKSTIEGTSPLYARKRIKDQIKVDEIKDFPTDSGKIIKDFDLKKAVIYSEILNRKYV